MKRTTLWLGVALSAWLINFPAGSAWAQTGGGATNAQGSTTPTGGVGATTGVGGGVGGAYGGASGNTYGNIISGNNTNRPNLNNAGAADRFRGQGIDRSGDAPLTGGNRNQFDRYNGGGANSVQNARDRNRTRQERWNDNDDFQSDPYQSSRDSSDQGGYDRRRDSLERRRYQEERLLDGAGRDEAAFDHYGRRPNFSGRYYNRDTTNVYIDDGYNDGYAVDGAMVDDYGNYIGRGVGTQYAPQRSTTTNRAPYSERSYNQNRLRYRGVNPSPMSSESRRSMDRAAHTVDANRGRNADEKLDEELGEDSGTTAARRVDARVDPRGR